MMDTLEKDTAEKSVKQPPQAQVTSSALEATLGISGVLILPVRRMVLFPGLTIPIAVGRTKSISAIELAGEASLPIGVFMQKEANLSDPDIEDLSTVGTLARVMHHVAAPDGTHHIIVRGETRIRIGKRISGLPCLAARFTVIEQSTARNAEIDARFLQLRTQALEAISLLPNTPGDLAQTVASIDDPSLLADIVAQHLDLESQEKQAMLETYDLKAKLDRMLELLVYRVEVLRISRDIGRRTEQSLTGQQRQHILREQLIAIRKELGEVNGESEELAALKAQIETCGMHHEAETEALKQHARLERMSESSTGYSMMRSYLETLVDLPWTAPKPKMIDLEEAKTILDQDHYDLKKIKTRILEHLAVRKLNPDGRSPILCFTGPPGVGKTSLGQSIARAMDRKFIRLSLGGIDDESEIRGHRMTYIGAMPGNIIKSLQRVGTQNCVFMLDEIDKLGRSGHGDPAAALLEVLDPVQNSAFRDSYLNLPFDLSKVVFITTANVVEAIPGPLRDRMEVIQLSGYTPQEKRQIAELYLVKRQLSANGLKPSQCTMKPAAIDMIIESYTWEAGVRNLEREIGAVMRAAAMRIATGEAKSVTLGPKQVEAALGPPKYERDIAMLKGAPGVATGLAWTAGGGEILFIEAIRYPGSGKLTLTGQLGNVMRESAEAALSLVKSLATRISIEPADFTHSDIHIHVPAGAIPKDGPSAGAAIFLALVSALKGECVRSDTAITGEISLRGLILPVGGIKDKVIAADRAGVTRILLPKRNQHDQEEIPESVLEHLEIIWIDTVLEAQRMSFGPC